MNTHIDSLSILILLLGHCMKIASKAHKNCYTKFVLECYIVMPKVTLKRSFHMSLLQSITDICNIMLKKFLNSGMECFRIDKQYIFKCWPEMFVMEWSPPNLMTSKIQTLLPSEMGANLTMKGVGYLQTLKKTCYVGFKCIWLFTVSVACCSKKGFEHLLPSY